MALDTRSKRASSVSVLLISVLSPVLPDGTIGQGDRQHTANHYSGVLAAAPDVDGFYIYLKGSVNRTTMLVGSVNASRGLRGSVNDTFSSRGSI